MEIEEETAPEMEIEDRVEESPLTHQPTNDPGYRIIPDVSEERLATVDKARVERNIIRLEAEKDNLKKNVNLGAIAEYVNRMISFPFTWIYLDSFHFIFSIILKIF